MRKIMMAGNWKMNMTPAQAKAFIEELKAKTAPTGCEVVLCAPYTSLAAAAAAASGSRIAIGAQNCHWAESGAFTAEISAGMLVETGVDYVIIGHSERRQFFGETDKTVNQRTKAALKAGLKVILCVGESLEQREKKITDEINSIQIKLGLEGISESELENIIIAYEPVWAIGTGVTATSAQAEETIAAIRAAISGIYGAKAAGAMQILYGGSMNPANTAELLSMENIDGGLIGGASLKTADFAAMIDMGDKAN